MTVRDFTDGKKPELESIINEVEVSSNYWCGQLADFFADVRIGDTLMSAYADVTAYHTSILDIKNTTKAQLDAIWSNVYDIEAAHLAKMQGIKARIGELAAEFGRLAEALDPNRPGGLLVAGSGDALMRFFNESFDVEEAYDLHVQREAFALMDEPGFSEEAWEACTTDAERQDFLNRFFARV